MEQMTNIPPSFSVNYELKATKWVRFFNLFIDYIAMYLIIFILAAITGVIAAIFELIDVFMWMQNISTLESYAIGFVVLVLYYTIFESLSGRTLGKLITGSKVVMVHGGAKPTSDVILRRSLCRVIPFDFLSFLGENSVGWHDSISQTTVVDAKRFDAAMNLKISFDELGSNNENTIY